MEKKILILLFTLAGFFIADKSWAIMPIPEDTEHWSYVAAHLFNRAFWYVLFPILIVAILYRPANALGELGLSASLPTGFRVAFLCTLPMLIGFAILSGFEWQLNWRQFLFGCLLAALGEEILYRGFLFGQLYRRVGLPFIIAALPMALYFGFSHIYQGKEMGDSIGIFMITLMGGFWFSWLYIAWGENLWVPIIFHFLMNLYWTGFTIDDSALGGSWANILRGATIALSIWLTLRQAPNARFSIWKKPTAPLQPINGE